MIRSLLRPAIAAAILLPCILGAAHAATFTVTNTTSVATSGGCDADCSLHDAITAANATTAADTIAFAIAGTGVKTIALDADGLPTITRPLTIDGYTQTGASVNTASIGSNAVLTIAITRPNPDPINDTLINALTFAANATASSVRGIAFVQLGATSVNFIGIDADGVTISGNFFGTNAAGDNDGGQAPSTAINVGTSANAATIGGAQPAARNLFAGIEEGIALFGTNAIVQNNLFGVEDNGTTRLDLGDVAILTSGDGHRIGGTNAGEGNLFTNIGGHAVLVTAQSTGNRILGNRFFGNFGLAINLEGPDDPPNGVTSNDIGDGDTGANDLQNLPEIFTAERLGTTTTVTMRLLSAPNRTYRIELFSNTTSDPSSFGEGERLITTRDIVTDGSGIGSASISLTNNEVLDGDIVTATATDQVSGNTSEFSRGVTVARTLTVNTTSDAIDGSCNPAHCSLREALQNANVSPGPNRVLFAIPGTGPHTIVIGPSGLPPITERIIIEGGSQSGSSPNSRNDDTNDADRMIVLSAPTLDPLADLMTLAEGSDASVVSGLVFRDIDAGAGDLLEVRSDDNSISNCAFGMDAAGLSDGGNSGLAALHIAGNRNRVGGASAAGRIQIGGVRQALLVSGNSNLFGNLTIGLSSNGTANLPVTGPSTVLVTGSFNLFDDDSDVVARIIGNAGKGIEVGPGAVANSIGNVRFIANGGIPIDLAAANDPASGITPNDTNDGDIGANNLQNHPIITIARRNPDGSGVISGTLATNPDIGTAYRIDLYHGATVGNTGIADVGVLLDRVDVTVNAQGISPFTATVQNLPLTGFVSATATRISTPKDTSEFSPSRAIVNAPIVVVNTNVSGTGSLAQAILAANATPGADEIRFDIPGAGPHRIDVGPSGLPTVTGPVLIDGYTQTGATANSLASGFNGVIRIEVVANAGDDSLQVLRFSEDADGSTVRGLAIFNLGAPTVTDGIRIEGADGVVLQGNLIGTDASGNTGGGFRQPLRFAEASIGGLVGGVSPSQRNLFAHNRGSIVFEGDAASVFGNIVGMQRNGTVSGGVIGSAIAVLNGSALIGDGDTGGNVLAGYAFGIGVSESAGLVQIRGNRFESIRAQVIELEPFGPQPNDPGDADSGTNGLQNHPEFTSARTVGSTTQISGRLNSTPNTAFAIDLFEAEGDADDQALAARFLDAVNVTTDATGLGSFSFTLNPALPVGSFVAATATVITTAPGATSEMSPTMVITGPDLVVTSPNDVNDGNCNTAHCSLREALLAANANVDVSRVRFDIPGAGPVFTIVPQSPLPPILEALILDGYSQPGASPNTNAEPPNNAVIRIVLDGSAIAGLSSNPEMLSVQSSDVDILGLSIVGLEDGSIGNEGITSPTNVNLATANIRIRGNYIGMLPDGLTTDGNHVGIELGGEAIDTGNEIGGPFPEHQNVIAGNGQHGIIGSSGGLIVQNNLIGTARDGTTPRGNSGNGIQFGGANGALFVDNRIAHNDNGVVLTDSARGVGIDPNSIHSNARLAIDLGGNGITPNDALDADIGANSLTNAPELVLAAASCQSRSIVTTLSARAETIYDVSFYAERTCAPDGIGEGERLLDTQTFLTDSAGKTSRAITLTLPPGFSFVTAIATEDASNETSEFSRCALVPADTVFADSFE